MKKRTFYKILFLVTFWVLAAIFIVSYEASIMHETTETDAHYSFFRTLFVAVLTTLVSGTAMASFEVLFLNRLLRRHPYGIALLIKTVFYLSCMCVFISLATLLIYSFELNQPIFHQAVLARYAGYVSSPQVVMTLIYWGITVLFSLFMLQVSDKFGQGVLLNFLMGKYNHPREERLIFMFMDLKSSTTYAERLGHLKYSQLIQDCFFDLTDIVAQHRAGIYQYVGDEVVLTWDMQKEGHLNDCIQVFYSYDAVLRRRRSHYEVKYGFVPKFKAGLNAGKVTVAEVGEIKKELAYHGDVLNTASRIQEKCNELDRRLLISEGLKDLMEGQNDYAFGFMGEVALKGKALSVCIYDVQQTKT